MGIYVVLEVEAHSLREGDIKRYIKVEKRKAVQEQYGFVQDVSECSGEG